MASADRLLLTDLVLAECVYVLESFYAGPPAQVAELMRAAISLSAIETVDPASLLRAIEVYELDRLVRRAVPCRPSRGDRRQQILSFDRSIDRFESVTRREP